MRFKTLIIILSLVIFTGVMTTAAFSQEVVIENQKVPFLFVQTADAGSFDGETLTLEGVGPSVFFSDRPYRINGHVTTDRFVEVWNEGEDSFKEDPPNAVLSFFVDEKAVNVVMELSDPEYDEGTLTYTVKVLDGEIPEEFGQASLFIDHGGDAGWGAAGGLLGGLLLGKVMDGSSQQQPSQTVVYTQPPQPDYSYYRQAPPAACTCAPCPACR
jgi:hypothetical protein